MHVCAATLSGRLPALLGTCRHAGGHGRRTLRPSGLRCAVAPAALESSMLELLV